MAGVFAAVLWSTGGALATEAAVFLLANATAVNTVAMIAGSALIGNYQKRKAAAAARAAYNASLEDRLVLQAMVQGPRKRVYGRVRNVDGLLFKATHGTDSEYYTWVVALAGHEVDAIEQIYFNDTPITLDGDGYVTTAPWDDGKVRSGSISVTVSGGAGSGTLPHEAVGGSVTATLATSDEINGSQTFAATASVSGTSVTLSAAPVDGTYTVYYQWTDTSKPAVRVRQYLGGAGQNLYTDLQATIGGTLLETTDRFEGVAALIVTMRYSQDAFPTGVPSITAVLRGAKVTDPRTGLTEWTENPALIARDWALYAHGGGLTEDDLVADVWEAAANACDVSTTFTTSTGDETRALYQAGIAIPLDENTAPDEVLSEIVAAMAGQWCWTGGQITVRAGVYRAPVATITEDWVTTASDIGIVPQTATADLVNVMRPTIADAAKAYVAAPTAEVRSATFFTADGDVEWPRELTLGAITRAVHAQHVCGVLMREARDGMTVQLPCNLRAWQLQVLDVVAVTLPAFGWSSKPFEVVGWRFSIAGGVALSLREISAGNYSVDAELATDTSADNTSLPDPTSVPQVEGVTLSSGTTELVDGTLVTRLLVEWDTVAQAAVQQSGSIEVQYAKAVGALDDDGWTSAPAAPGSSSSTTIYGLQNGVHYLVRVRARNTLGVAGQWSYHEAIRITGQRRPVVWYQDTAPTSGESQDGDQWVDTDNGNRVYRRTSGAWEAMLVGTAAIDDAAATDVEDIAYEATGVTHTNIS